MRNRVPDVLEKGRVVRDGFASFPGEFFGFFYLKAPTGSYLKVMAGKGDPAEWPFPGPPWDHVSVSLADSTRDPRCPTWEEMCWVKGLFWDDEECVIQFHPPKSQYVNVHPYCLHLWKPLGVEIPLPPKGAVG